VWTYESFFPKFGVCISLKSISAWGFGTDIDLLYYLLIQVLETRMAYLFMRLVGRISVSAEVTQKRTKIKFRTIERHQTFPVGGPARKSPS
jgi:hypothetical protein